MIYHKAYYSLNKLKKKIITMKNSLNNKKQMSTIIHIKKRVTLVNNIANKKIIILKENLMTLIAHLIKIVRTINKMK